ncbi:hypothetical protein GH5_03504 [Leishmania sp. Ghana 2012 LV757]|uniref:hypothetical protein n=1 Tax=Leishmania sp. Ghana 2012 LV757 TaxID=2803181 RepID=UPI001B44390B|nr:hypothetical protein GH5_03504 [Leishmania sp. Ghana 2012 LV757]
MALSYHVVLSSFLLFAFADLVLLSVRTLVSRRYQSLTLCYALMAVQESMLVFELLAVMGQVLSTYLVIAGMWGHTASLLSAFVPLWWMRAFLTVFAVVYKNSLLPRSPSAAVSAPAGVWEFFSHSSRAWRSRGYGAVVSLDIACCCLYYLSAVYVLGYVSEKTLYVPYHRRRWRHMQRKRSRATTATTAVAGEENRETARQKRPREERQGDARSTDGGGGGRVVTSCPAVMSLARTPSFLQWKAVLQRQQQEAGKGRGTSAGDDVAPSDASEGSGPGGNSLASTVKATRRNANALQSPSSSEAEGRRGELARGNSASATTLVPGSAAKAPECATQPSSSKHLSSPGADIAAAKRQRAAQRHDGKPATRAPHGAVSTAALTGAGSTKQPQPVSLFTNLPPLQLSRRFTISNSEEEERRLHHFATALVKHGYTSSPPLMGNSTPELPPSRPRVESSSGGIGRSATSAATAVPTAHGRDVSEKGEGVGNPFSSTVATRLAGEQRSRLSSSSSQKHAPRLATTSLRRSMSLMSVNQDGSASSQLSGTAVNRATPPPPRSSPGQDSPHHQ